MENFEPEIESVTVIPSDEGRFEVTVNSSLLYSKHETLRHAKPGEVVDLIKTYLQDDHR